MTSLAVAASLALCAHGAPLPANIVAQLSGRLPAAYTPMPAASVNTIYPLASAARPSKDRRWGVAIGDTAFAVTAVSEDGRSVEMLVPDGRRAGEWTNRYFSVEDVFGKAKWKLEAYVPGCQAFAYLSAGKGVKELFGRVEPDTKCASLGTVQLGKAAERLALIRTEREVGPLRCEYAIAMLREAPPVKTKKEYDVRAAELFAEHAYRNGREWGKMHPALLTKEGCYDCAGMASDFACYMFGTGFNDGVQYDNAAEIRSGDIVHTTHHYFVVVHRNGDELHTIEGNLNEQICQSKKRYSIKDGQLMCGGQPAGFDYGRHCFEETPASAR